MIAVIDSEFQTIRIIKNDRQVMKSKSFRMMRYITQKWKRISISQDRTITTWNAPKMSYGNLNNSVTRYRINHSVELSIIKRSFYKNDGTKVFHHSIVINGYGKTLKYNELYFTSSPKLWKNKFWATSAAQALIEEYTGEPMPYRFFRNNRIDT